MLLKNKCVQSRIETKLKKHMLRNMLCYYTITRCITKMKKVTSLLLGQAESAVIV